MQVKELMDLFAPNGQDHVDRTKVAEYLRKQIEERMDNPTKRNEAGFTEIGEYLSLFLIFAGKRGFLSTCYMQEKAKLIEMGDPPEMVCDSGKAAIWDRIMFCIQQGETESVHELLQQYGIFGELRWSK